jgi:hypothetical protein
MFPPGHSLELRNRLVVESRWNQLVIAAWLVIVCTSPPCAAINDVAGDMIVFNDNGAWSWFEDERAIVDTSAGKILVSSVANGSGSGGSARSGDVEVAALDLANGSVSRFTLSDALQADDHNSAALWIRPDGRYLAMYARHGSDSFSRYRISTNPGSITSWGAEQTFDNGAGTTYSNLHYLPNDNGGAGRLYNFTRSVGFDPNVLVSNNFGSNWSYGGRLLAEGTASDRPYLRYFSDGQRIHLITTERHPRNFDNSIYHGYVDDGQLLNSTGMVKDANLFDASGVAPASLTPIFITGTQFSGTTMRRAWTIDVAIDEGGLPYAVFQARADDNNTDHRFFYARFNGTNWAVHELAKAGGFLYAAEDDYTGLAALVPGDPNRLFISTKIDPRTNITMPRYEIFEGATDDGGASWTWAPITFNSTVDNLRPIIPDWDAEQTALLWMRGTYTTYTNYNLDIVGLTEFVPLSGVSGDLDSDGDLDLDDFSLYLSGLHANLSGLTPEQAFMRGDLNGDFANNFNDFVIFRQAYDLVHGAGALAAHIQSAPEPPGVTMLAFGVGGVIVCGTRTCNSAPLPRGSAARYS